MVAQLALIEGMGEDPLSLALSSLGCLSKIPYNHGNTVLGAIQGQHIIHGTRCDSYLRPLDSFPRFSELRLE